MHSVAIFFGWLLIGWGLIGVKLPLFILKMPDEQFGPWEGFWDKWAPHLVAAAILPLPVALFICGVALMRWGFGSG